MEVEERAMSALLCDKPQTLPGWTVCIGHPFASDAASHFDHDNSISTVRLVRVCNISTSAL
jgi:hypothetical protein